MSHYKFFAKKYSWRIDNDWWLGIFAVCFFNLRVDCSWAIFPASFFLIFRSFRIFLCSKSFWIAWLLPYLLLSAICVSAGLRISMEWSLLELHIGGLFLPLVYFLRKTFIRKHSNLVPNKLSSWIIWAIPMSICSFFIHLCLYVRFIYYYIS